MNFNSNRTTYKEFCWCLGIGFCNIWWLVFELLTPFTLGGHNFLNSIPFLTIFNAPNVTIQVLLTRQLPLDLTYFEHLNIIVATQFAINEQLKDLTHMLCLWIPCYQLYREGLFSYILTLKYMCHFGMSFKKLNLKARHKIKTKISWLLFNALNLVFSYLINYLGK